MAPAAHGGALSSERSSRSPPLPGLGGSPDRGWGAWGAAVRVGWTCDLNTRDSCRAERVATEGTSPTREEGACGCHARMRTAGRSQQRSAKRCRAVWFCWAGLSWQSAAFVSSCHACALSAQRLAPVRDGQASMSKGPFLVSNTRLSVWLECTLQLKNEHDVNARMRANRRLASPHTARNVCHATIRDRGHTTEVGFS